MKKTLLALALVASIAGARANPAPSSNTVEVSVVGLNCSLCSEEMKTNLKTLSGAQDIEPRLECGKIYLAMPPGAQLNERLLSAALLKNGFTYEGAKPATKTLAAVRKTSPDAC